MLENVQLYYFSPTGGTKAYGDYFCQQIAHHTDKINLGLNKPLEKPEADLVVFALPVFSGRIPAYTRDKLQTLKGNGKKAIALVVYGTRAYEDALLELCDLLQNQDFKVIGAATLIAQHSIVGEVGKNRPDEADFHSMHDFISQILEKNDDQKITVPGNYPYKEVSKQTITPISLDTCVKCGKCVTICPTKAIHLDENGLQTDVDACMLCMACTKACIKQARILPPAVQKNMNEKLAPLIPIHKENEYFL